MDYNYHIKGAMSYMGKSIFYFVLGFIFTVLGGIMVFYKISFYSSGNLIIDYKFGLVPFLTGLALVAIVLYVEYKVRLPIRIFNKVKRRVGDYLESDNMLWELTMDSGYDVTLKHPICPKPECGNFIAITYLADDCTQMLHTCNGCNNQWKGKTLESEKWTAITKLNRIRKEMHLYELGITL